MHKFGVTAWPDKTNYTIEVLCGESADLHRLTPEEASEFLGCIEQTLTGGQCVHTHVHRIEVKKGNMFTVLLPVNARHTKAYTVSKRKLVELKVELMGAVNG